MGGGPVRQGTDLLGGLSLRVSLPYSTPMPTKLHKEGLENFWYFVQERHNVYYKRFVLGKPQPWTKDPILQQYHFTNVYRELDRGTLYLTEEIIKQYQPVWKGHEGSLLFNILIYRLFNHIPTYKFLLSHNHYGPFVLGHWHWKKMAKALKAWNAMDYQVFTSAFTVTGNPFGGFHSKIDNICWLIDWLQSYLQQGGHKASYKNWEKIWHAPNMAEAFKEVKSMKGFGAFLAYEIVVDLNYAHARWGEDSFVNTGPGAYRGLRYIFPTIERRDGGSGIRWLHSHQPRIVHGKQLSLRNIEHSLCEYQKYRKFQTGTVRGRQRKFLGPKAKELPGQRRKI